MATAKSLTAQEIERVLAYIQTQPYAERNRAMFLFTILSGCRISEISSLTLADVQNADGTIKGEMFLAAHRVKHNHARTVFISQRLQAELAHYISSRTWLSNDLPLFSTRKGARHAFSANMLAQHFHYLYRRANVYGASSHSGRKTFITSLASQGVSVFVLASLAGHSQISTTQKYVTTNDDMKRRAVELV